MNNNYSSNELKYKRRWLTSLIEDSIKVHPIVVITGARQVGKSTFLRHDPIISKWKYYTLDDFDTLAQAQRDPEALWINEDYIVIDEAHKVPALLTAIKKAIDSSGKKKRFVLSGSANLLLMRQVSETLAGRAVYFILSPMALGEMLDKKPEKILDKLLNFEPIQKKIFTLDSDVLDYMLQGFMPALMGFNKLEHIVQWWEGYIATYLERDLRNISHVASLVDFRRLMEILSLRNAQLLNQSEVARDAQLPQPTAHRYINLLETTHLLERLPVFAKNKTKRLVKTQKLFWVDPGLTSFLGGYHDKKNLSNSREIGGIFETLVFHHLRILSRLLIPAARLYYWRTTIGKEVDFIVEHGRRFLAVEVKFTPRPHDGDVENLRYFLMEYPGSSCGVLIHAGNEIRYFDRNIVALPWTYLAMG